MELSIIIPFANEWAQNAFTARAVHENLGPIEHEVIMVDNWHEETMRGQGREPDRGHRHLRDKKDNPPGPEGTGSGWCPGHIEAQAKQSTWLQYVRYDEKLSHWGAKRAGIATAKGKWLLFLDAHVVPARGSLEGALTWLHDQDPMHGTLHMPLTYHILEDRWLAYKPDLTPENGYVGYGFTGFPGKRRGLHEVIEVPCMSTCGMFISRDLYDWMGGWSSELGIYGGGENYMNYVLAILGKSKCLWCGGVVHHHGDRRGYNWTYDDSVRNRGIAMYCIGGETWLTRYYRHLAAINKGRPEVLAKIRLDILETCEAQRQYIEARQTITIEDWIEQWKNWTFASI
jgi:glycosyltransferase involved in cell wall biosynthesis